MDTRTKIVSATAGAERLRALESDWTLVIGYFDPVVAAHADRLAELAADGRRVAVLILDPPDPLMDSRSRAEVVAAFGCVDLVMMPPEGDVEAWLDRLTGGRIAREEQADLARRDAVITHVHKRHALAAGR